MKENRAMNICFYHLSFIFDFIYYIIFRDATAMQFEQKLRCVSRRSIRNAILQRVQDFCFIKSIHLDKLDESASVIVLTSLQIICKCISFCINVGNSFACNLCHVVHKRRTLIMQDVRMIIKQWWSILDIDVFKFYSSKNLHGFIISVNERKSIIRLACSLLILNLLNIRIQYECTYKYFYIYRITAIVWYRRYL